MPDTLTSLHASAQQLINKGHFKQAHEQCLKILTLSPHHADCHFLLGMIAQSMQQFKKSIALIEMANEYSKNNPEYLAFLAKAHVSIKQFTQSKQALKQAIAIGSDSPHVNDTIGVTLSRLGEHEQAITFFEKAIAIAPNNPTLYFNVAASYKFTGKFCEAENAYEHAITIKPDYVQAHSALAELGRNSKNINRVERLKSLLGKVQDKVDQTLHVCHALAKELESSHQYEESLYYLKMGNTAKKQQLNYKVEDEKSIFDAIKQVFGTLDKNAPGCLSNKPIFIVGMPRSGTTLVDRILSNHSSVSSAGELQNFPVKLKQLSKTRSNKVLDLETIEQSSKINFEDLGKDYLKSVEPLVESKLHFIDKLPLNFLYIGFIKKALPNAKIIILDRQPLDVCISNLRALFAVNFSYYNYAYDLEDIAEYISLFENIVAFWREQYQDELLTVNYEKLVDSPHKVIGEILTYCNLEWEDSCVAFHTNPSSVSTASSVQVREPLSNKSIGRWKNYGQGMDKAKAVLIKNGLL